MDAVKDLKWLVVIIIGLWLVWFLTGGPTGEKAVGGSFLKPPAPLNTGTTYGELPSGSLTKNKTDNPNRRDIYLSDIDGARKSISNGEFIEITSSFENKNLINITNWLVKNSQREKLYIGKASKLPYLNRINRESSLYIKPGEKAIISTGRSPIGVSFKVNKCSGYLEQFQDFTPPLSSQCPHPLSNPNLGSYSLDDGCLSYITSIPSCQTPLNPPLDLSVSCLYFIEEEINYNSCVNTYNNSPIFYEPEWRIYLKQTKGMWNNLKEKIDILDSNEKMVDTIWY